MLGEALLQPTRILGIAPSDDPDAAGLPTLVGVRHEEGTSLQAHPARGLKDRTAFAEYFRHFVAHQIGQFAPVVFDCPLQAVELAGRQKVGRRLAAAAKKRGREK